MSHFRKSLSDSLLQSIMAERFENHQASGEVIEKINLIPHLPSSEEVLSYKNLNMKGSMLLRKWAEAVANGNEIEAQRYSRHLDEMAEFHHFPWLETKKIFLEAFVKPDRWMYRDWRKSKKQMEFGMINHRLPSDAKLAVLGDWGTGSSDALFLLDELFKVCMPDVVLHTGDIYFSCTSLEVQQNFILPFERAFRKIGKRVPIFTIAGNHDYYSGGQSFYRMLDLINAPLGEAYRQEASYFCLRTEDERWQIVGGDTSINDRESFKNPVSNPGLKHSECQWVKDKLTFSGKTILMTHHQLVDDECLISKDQKARGRLKHFNDTLLGQLGECFPKIHVWLWGHCHKFAAYQKGFPIPDTPLKLPFCRLIGGSAREVSSVKTLWQDILVKDEKNNPLAVDQTNHLYNHSFAIIDLGEQTVSYYQVPAWKEGGAECLKKLPQGQKRCFFSERISDC